MTRLQGWIFVVLVLATAGAFFVAQELKSSKPVVQQVQIKPFFSPNGDGRFDRARASFVLKDDDDVTATVVDHDGDEVRVLSDEQGRRIDDREIRAKQRVRLVWDGKDADGKMVKDGTYRIELNLRKQGRTVQLPRNIEKDTTPPDVRVLSIGPQRDTVPRPEILPRTDGKPAKITFKAPQRETSGQCAPYCSRLEIAVWRTDVVPARSVYDKAIKLRDGTRSWEWDGKGDGGRRVAAGTYVVVVRGRDQAGNIGTSVPLPIKLRFDEPFPGKGGITVRYLTAQGPTNPVVAGQEVSVAVASVDERFSWRVRRAGDPSIRGRGSGTKSRVVRFKAPGGKSGLYLFEVNTATRRTATPFVVQAEQKLPVLVVLPQITWQGRNARDDDGDGRINTLGSGLPVRLGRSYAGDGVPAQIRDDEALLLTALDRQGRRYDITTDVALTRSNVGSQIEGHKAVILPGDFRWLDNRVGRKLVEFVRGGGKVFTVGTGSLKRAVEVTPRGRAINPTAPTDRDIFGALTRPLDRDGPFEVTNTVDDIDLFAGTGGAFTGFSAVEPTANTTNGKVRAAATTQDGRTPVIVATAIGKGLVIRTGLPEFSSKLRSDTELNRFLSSVWAELRK